MFLRKNYTPAAPEVELRDRARFAAAKYFTMPKKVLTYRQKFGSLDEGGGMSAEDKTPIADEYVLITADKCTMENGYLTVTVPVVANKVYQLSIDEGMAGGKLRIVFIGVPEGQVEISPVWDGKSNTFFVKTRKLRPDMVQPPPQRWIQ